MIKYISKLDDITVISLCDGSIFMILFNLNENGNNIFVFCLICMVLYGSYFDVLDN